MGFRMMLSVANKKGIIHNFFKRFVPLQTLAHFIDEETN
jgi:hypothetical protein